MNTFNNNDEVHPERIKNPAVEYEDRDLSPRAVFIFLIALAITIIIAHLVIWSMFRTFGHQNITPLPRSTAISTPARELPGGDPVRAFPAPQLQPDPVADLNKFRSREEQILHSYDFVDKDKVIVRIPIDRAMQLLLQRGLPVRQPGQVTASMPGVTSSGESGGTSATAGGSGTAVNSAGRKLQH